MLNPYGIFCFITSNSWLGAEYGIGLQEFLIKYVPIIAIYDNQSKRTFEHADINTIVSLFGAPKKSNEVIDNFVSNSELLGTQWPGLNNIVHFVMFKKPFNEEHLARDLMRIDETNEFTTNENYRVYPISQRELLEKGWKYPDSYELNSKNEFIIGKYVGDLWSIYLQAPQIYFTCLSKQKTIEIQVSQLFEKNERYLNTGGADGFFILTSVRNVEDGYYEIENTSKEAKKEDKKEAKISKTRKFKIPKKYLKPLIKDYTKDSKCIEIDGYDAYVLVIGEKPTDQYLKNYIKWGEKVGFNKRSVTKGQNPWYRPTFQMLRGGKILFPRSFNDSYIIFYNPNEYVSLRFFRLYPKRGLNERSIIAILNSTYFALHMELSRAGNLGLGVSDVSMATFLKIKIPYNNILNEKLHMKLGKMTDRSIGSVFKESGIDFSRPIIEQIPSPLNDRKQLDDIIFDAIGLTTEERNEVYLALCELVRNRFQKANSFQRKQ